MSDNSKAKTKNYGMNLPSFSEFADIREIDENFEKIDELIKVNETSIENIEIDNEKILKEHNIDKNSHEDIRKKIGTDIATHNTNKDAHASGIKGNAASATKLDTARKINGVNFDGTADITITAKADGGNADTVGGKRATDLMRYMGYYPYALLSAAEPNTVYTIGGATTDMPAGAYNYGCLETTGTSTKMVQRYTTHGVDGSSTGQFASWYRVSYGGDYSAWKKIATITDNVASATKLQTARSITVGNATKNFDGSANVGFSLAEMGISASAMGGIVASSLGETGWAKYANGLIEQWGYATVPAFSTATITLPIEFNSAIYNIQTTVNNTTADSRGDKQDWSGASPASLNAIVIRNGFEHNISSSKIWWRVMGV